MEAGKRMAESFPKNYALLESIENVKAGTVRESLAQTREKCEMCVERQALFGCIECETKYCEGCWGVYHKVRALRRHGKVGLGDVFEAKCPDHPSKTAELVIDVLFGELSCPSHKDHPVDALQQSTIDKHKELQLAISNAQRNIDSALSVLVNLQGADELPSAADKAGNGEGSSSTGFPDKTGDLTPTQSSTKVVGDSNSSAIKRTLRITIDYPGQGRWLRVIAGTALIMDIHVRDAADQYKMPKGKLRALAFPYTGKHGKKPKGNNQIDVPVLPNPTQPGRFKIEWTPNLGKYDFAILYNSQIIGHKKHFILKVKKKFP